MSNTAETEAVKAADAVATGTLVSSQNGRLRGIVLEPGGTAGDALFKDGGSGGTEICQIHTPASGAPFSITIPGGGIGFGTDLHVTLTNVAGVTVFYAQD